MPGDRKCYMLQNKSHESQVRENATSYMLKKRYPESQVYIIYRVSQKNIVSRNIAKTLIKLPFRSVKGRSGGSHICRHIGDMGTCARHPVMAQMCSAPQNTHIFTAQKPLSKNSSTFLKRIFFGHPVVEGHQTKPTKQFHILVLLTNSN